MRTATRFTFPADIARGLCHLDVEGVTFQLKRPGALPSTRFASSARRARGVS